MDIWVDLVRLSGSFILLSAFAAKLLGGPKSFVMSVQRYGTLPPWTATALAYLTLLAEIIVGAGLMLGRFESAFLFLAGLLFAGFASLGFASTRHPQERAPDCGCLGKYVRLRLDSFSVAKNLFVAAASSAAALVNHFGISSPLMPGSGLPAAVTVACAALVAGMYWVSSYASSVVSLVEEAFEASET
jgi:hypothetical protein